MNGEELQALAAVAVEEISPKIGEDFRVIVVIAPAEPEARLYICSDIHNTKLLAIMLHEAMRRTIQAAKNMEALDQQGSEASLQ